MSDSWFVNLSHDAAVDNVRRQWRFGDKAKARRWNAAWLSTFGVDLIQRIEADESAALEDDATSSNASVSSAANYGYEAQASGNAMRTMIRLSGGLFVFLGILAVIVSAILALMSFAAGALAALLPTLWVAISGASCILFGGVAYMLCSIDERLERDATRRLLAGS
jgi:hypothetical protein